MISIFMKTYKWIFSGKDGDMRKVTIYPLILFLTAFTISCTSRYSKGHETEIKEPVKLLLLHTNDMHAQYIPREAFWVDSDNKPLIGGFGALKAYIDRERANEIPSILLDAGDLMTGTPLSNIVVDGIEGGALLTMMGEIGYDVMTLGNHEFDNGQENMSKFFEHAAFPIINANLLKDGKLITPSAYEILYVAGIKVGVIGLMTEEFFEVTAKSMTAGLELGNTVELTNEIVNKIDPVTDLIILLTHADVEEDMALAREVPWIDIIVGGHSHSRLAEPIVENGVIIVQAGSRTSNLGWLEFSVQGDSISDFSGKLIETWVDSIDIDSALGKIIEEFENAIADIYGDTLATLLNDLVRSSSGESNIGSWIASIIKETTYSDFGIINSGGIRKGMNAGPLTKLDIIEILPFKNYLSTFEISGEDLLSLMTFMAEKSVKSNRHDLQLSGISYKYKTNDKGVELIEPKVGGSYVIREKIYKAGTIDFVSDSQPLLYLGLMPSNIEHLNLLLSDAVMKHAKDSKVIEAKLSGAITKLE